MDLFGRFHDGLQPKSPSAVAVYVGGHLAPTIEAGDLVAIPGYLSREGTILPMVSDRDLWREVGWDPGKLPLPSRKLIESLTQGFDIHGRKLAGRGQFRAPKEVVFSLPSELSQALMELSAENRLSVMQDLHTAWIRERDRMAIRIMKDGDRTWHAARTLSLGFVHLEDRAGEPSLHFHDYAFAVAKDGNGKWRAYENGKIANDMPRVRAVLTDTAIESCARLGIEIDWPRGLARERDGQVQGVTVRMPSGRVLEAGSLIRTRRADIMAAQTIRETLGVPALTSKELELIRRETGKLPLEIRGVKRMDYLAVKLNTLGLLDAAGRILPRHEVEVRLPKIAEGLGLAAAKLREIPVPGPRAEAMARVEQKIETIKTATPEIAPRIEAALAVGRIRWTVEYQRVMEMVAEVGKLRTDGLTKQDRDLLCKLKKAGLLEGEKVNGRMEYGLSKLGGLRISRSSVVSAADSVLPPLIPMAAGSVQAGSFRGFGMDGRNSEAAHSRCGAIGASEPGVAGMELSEAGEIGVLSHRNSEVGEQEGHRVPELGPGAHSLLGTIQSEAATPAYIYPGREIRADGPEVLVLVTHREHEDGRQVESISAGSSLQGRADGIAARHTLSFNQVYGPTGLLGPSGSSHGLPRASLLGGRRGGHREKANPRLGSHPRSPWDGRHRCGVYARPARMALGRSGWASLADEPGRLRPDHFGGGVGNRRGSGRFGGVSLNFAGTSRMVAIGELQYRSCGGARSHVEHVIHVATHSATRVGAIVWDLMAAAAGVASAAWQIAAQKISKRQADHREMHRMAIAEIERERRIEDSKLEVAQIADLQHRHQVESLKVGSPDNRGPKVKILRRG